MILSQRLLTLARFVTPGSRVADVGTDHALLPCYLVKEGIAPFVVGTDIHKGPYEAAVKAVENQQLSKRIEIRLGDGLKPVKPQEVEEVVLAGIGGSTMEDIFTESPDVVLKLRKLILQPMNGSERIRRWLVLKGWAITAEELLKEDGRIYEFIVAQKGASPELSEIEYMYGPLLIKNKHPLLEEVLEKELKKMQEVLIQLAKSESMEAQFRQREFTLRIKRVKELKRWLSAAQELSKP